jgi:putative two-component system response regulator
VFDALVHLRPYKPPWTVEAAALEIRNLTGRQFDPEVVAAFERLDHRELAGEHALLALT